MMGGDLLVEVDVSTPLHPAEGALEGHADGDSLVSTQRTFLGGGGGGY